MRTGKGLPNSRRPKGHYNHEWRNEGLRRRVRHVCFEHLEDRRLLSLTSFVDESPWEALWEIPGWSPVAVEASAPIGDVPAIYPVDPYAEGPHAQTTPL